MESASVTLLTYDEVPRSIYRRGFVVSFPFGQTEEIFFRVDSNIDELLKTHDGLANYLLSIHDYPLGIYKMESLDDEQYLLVIYNKKDISKEAVTKFIASLF